MTDAAAPPRRPGRDRLAGGGGGAAATPLVLACAALSALAGCVTSAQERRPAPAQPIVVSSDQLIGLSPTALLATLGSPRLLRRERPAEVWQYRVGSCVLDVFLYGTGEGARVVHLEARDGTAEPIAPQACLGAWPGLTGT